MLSKQEINKICEDLKKVSSSMFGILRKYNQHQNFPDEVKQELGSKLEILNKAISQLEVAEEKNAN